MTGRVALLLVASLGLVATAGRALAQEVAPLPAAGASQESSGAATPLAGASANGASAAVTASEPPAPTAPVQVASAPPVTADHPATPPPADDNTSGRRLRRSAGKSDAEGQAAPAAMPLDLLKNDATTTALAATALVVGLFLVCAWTFRRSLPKSSRPLPREAVEVLGRCPLGNKQYAHLLHVGNKVILVSITPHGAETLVEVDDPSEVARILGLCASSGSGSSTKEFDAIFQQFAKEPARGFLEEDASSYSHPYGQAGGSKRG